MRALVLPGIGGSGPNHWQSLWQARAPRARARRIARAWGARFVDLGDAGHVNTASGHDPWPEGLELLREISLDRRSRR